MADSREKDGKLPKAGDGAEGGAGNEPEEHSREHKSGYGGDGGKPKTSSDQREPQTPK